jgi:hypothetical protein
MLTDKQILEPVREFLLTYPYTTPVKNIAIDHGEIEKTGSDSSGEGNALRLVGRTRYGEKKSITGKVTTTWRISFSLVMWRDSNASNFRRDVGEFGLQFVQWVEDENAKRGTKDQSKVLPRFSDTENERISAVYNGQTATLPKERSQYQIAIHLDFQTVTRAQAVSSGNI